MSTRNPIGLLLLAASLHAGCGNVVRVNVDLGGLGGDDDAAVVLDLARSPDLASVCGPCAAPTPVCDPQARRCVACIGDGDCPAASVCRNNACVPGCSPQHNECGDAGACDVDMGRCHGCLSDRDCKDAASPFCDLASGRCIGCDPKNDRCPDGKYCAAMGNGFGCAPGCKVDVECQSMGASYHCCNHACADTLADRGNCGSCGNSCNAGACCKGTCANLDVDVKNCGGCGSVCAPPNAVPQCGAGKCTPGACVMGYADCNGLPADGCEVSTASDLNNCGGCGKACALPNAMALCVGGACALGSCANGYRNCDGMAANGCEVNAAIDPNNCGACGAACAQLPHAQAGCMNGGCVVGMCAPGFGNCDKMDNNGCEADLSSTAANCGACGNICPAPPNIQTGCVNGMCTKGACNQGFADCDANAVNGCEVNLGNDVNNCGKCGTKCLGMGANAVAACAMGGCTLSCNAGFADCDGDPGNGCEVNINTDASNCGACKKVCGLGLACVNGACAANAACQRNTTLVTTSPNKDVMVCDDPNNVICEQDLKTICPIGWNLCTPKMLANRKFTFALPNTSVGEIYCRGMGGAGGAGHYTVNGNLNAPPALNCTYGSSRPTCVTGYGCNEQTVSALCCQPSQLCGNGKVDGPEEECDDGNADDTDTCLSSCSWRVPVDHGLAGQGC